MRKMLHKISIASMVIGFTLMFGTMGSVEIDTMTIGEMLKYWAVGIVMILGGWKCSTLVKTTE